VTQPARPARENGGRRDPLLIVAAVVLLAALAFAGLAGWSLASAPRSAAAASGARDGVLQAGEQAVLNFNTLDYRSVGRGLRLWEQSSTGALHAEVVAGKTAFERQITLAKTVTTARILDAALTQLNLHAGTASIIVAIQITVTPAGGQAVTKQSRLVGTLTRTSSGWKLSALGQAPVGAASPAASPPG
jgi:Mce-associated membrane protein